MRAALRTAALIVSCTMIAAALFSCNDKKSETTSQELVSVSVARNNRSGSSSVKESTEIVTEVSSEDGSSSADTTAKPVAHIKVGMSDGSGFDTSSDAVNGFYNALIAADADVVYSQFYPAELEWFDYDEEALKESILSLSDEIAGFTGTYDASGQGEWYCLMEESAMKPLDPADIDSLNQQLGLNIEEFNTIDLTFIQSTLSEDQSFTFYGLGVMKINGAWYPSLAYFASILMS